MKHPPVRWSTDMQAAIMSAVRRCEADSDWTTAAYGIEATHLHLAITYTARDIDGTAKWLGQQMTKAVHTQTSHIGPVFCKNHWLEFIYDPDHWDRLLRYIDRHNKAADVIGGPPDDTTAAIDAFIREVEDWKDRG